MRALSPMPKMKNHWLALAAVGVLLAVPGAMAQTLVGDCGEVRADPGCSDATCSACVCSFDVACCTFGSWDSICVGEASNPDLCQDACTSSEPQVTDSDGDGVADGEDACPNSDLSPTVALGGCDSGVPNAVSDGCSLADVLLACAEGATNHGSFVRCVAARSNDLKSAGAITGAEKGAIQSCAARAR